MKIKEFVNEGLLGNIGKTLGSALGSVAKDTLKGVAGGIGSVVAPTGTEYLKKTKFALPKKPGEPTDPEQQPTKQPVSIPGFTVIDQDPMVVRYQGKDYALNNQGEWYSMSARGARPPLVKDSNPTLEKMLDKVAGF